MPVAIQSKRLTLRELRKSDAKSLYENANDYSVYRYTLHIPHPYALQDAENFIEKSRRDASSGKSYALGIELRQARKVIGVMSVEPKDWENRTGEIGYWIGRGYWNKGLGSEALGKMAEFCFKDLGLDYLYAKVLEPNAASARMLEKCGFVQDKEHGGSVLKGRVRYNELKFDLRGRGKPARA